MSRIDSEQATEGLTWHSWKRSRIRAGFRSRPARSLGLLFARAFKCLAHLGGTVSTIVETRFALIVYNKGDRGKVVYRSRLGGMLNFYYREAA